MIKFMRMAIPGPEVTVIPQYWRAGRMYSHEGQPVVFHLSDSLDTHNTLWLSDNGKTFFEVYRARTTVTKNMWGKPTEMSFVLRAPNIEPLVLEYSMAHFRLTDLDGEVIASPLEEPDVFAKNTVIESAMFYLMDRDREAVRGYD